MTTPLLLRCCGQVWTGYCHYPCDKAGKYIVEDKRYCGTHNPEKIAAKRKARDEADSAKWAATKAARDRLRRIGEERAADAARFLKIAAIAGQSIADFRKEVDAAREPTL